MYFCSLKIIILLLGPSGWAAMTQVRRDGADSIPALTLTIGPVMKV